MMISEKICQQFDMMGVTYKYHREGYKNGMIDILTPSGETMLSLWTEHDAMLFAKGYYQAIRAIMENKKSDQ